MLFAHETGSKVNYLEIYQAFVESQQDLNVQKSVCMKPSGSRSDQ